MASGTGQPCPKCGKPVFFAEKVTAGDKDWHRPCFRCERCTRVLSPGDQNEHDGAAYCRNCYAVLYGQGGYGRGVTQSHIYDDDPNQQRQ